MNCEWVKANIVLYLYQELADDARHELEQHVERCPGCAAEMRDAREFQEKMSGLPVSEPSPNLLAASRLRLNEGLETAEQGAWWSRWVFDLGGWMRQAKLAPALVTAVFMVGFAGGILATWQVTHRPNAGPGDNSAAQASIAGINDITQVPGTNQVQIKYDTLQPQSVQGSLDDPQIQQLLLYAARANANSGVRINATNILAQNSQDNQVREALMFSLRYDKNPGVRLKALDGLSPYVKDDIRVRNAVLEALMNDANQGVRSEAIHLLQPVRADSSVRQALMTLAAQDKNDYIRSEAKRILASTAQID
ncbi:MAG TPA: zf-HC2 domain-containing protein [Terriglobales bacterium]|nr:zf-HC2 domain-containing protein [Terriglobales bacterium]